MAAKATRSKAGEKRARDGDDDSADTQVRINPEEYQKKKIEQLESMDDAEKLSSIYEELLISIPTRFNTLENNLTKKLDSIIDSLKSHEDRICQLETKLKTLDVVATRTRTGIEVALPGTSAQPPDTCANPYVILPDDDEDMDEGSTSVGGFDLQEFLNRKD